ncbi:class I SAM-dependent methyltransferase [archaeon]|nr:class I SAM-dependent methyltransferase [archaeon]
MRTKRIQNNQIMCESEKKGFSKIIRTMPWLYSPILQGLKNKEEGTLCDVACGDGCLLELINKKHPNLKLNGIDIDKEFISCAKKNFPFNFKKEDAFKMKDKFDIITLNLALHHFDNPRKLIKHLLSITKKTLIISDQLRPEIETELYQRLEKRKKLVGNNETDYYDENEKESILEAYSESEIKEIFKGFNCKVKFVDNDYYKRFVCVINKEDLNNEDD